MTDLAPAREFIATLLARKGDTASINKTDRLVSSGRLDSVDVMEIVVFMEDRYALDFADRGVNIDDLDSLSAIEKMVNEMR